MDKMPSSSAVRALALEYKSLQEEPVEGFRVKLLNEDNLFEWWAELKNLSFSNTNPLQSFRTIINNSYDDKNDVKKKKKPNVDGGINLVQRKWCQERVDHAKQKMRALS